MQFQGPEDFAARWIQGLHKTLDEYRASGRKRYGDRLLSEDLVLRCLQDPFLRAYTLRFLERNFYRNYRERIRAKPAEELWSIWFGAGHLCWGLVISPSLREDGWTNDKSQMRRESYEYWTVGHALTTGLIDPTSPDPVRFSGLRDFSVFYKSVLKRVSNSLYERAICDAYLEYLNSSTDPNAEPLLIPELRYAGRDVNHQYRLDFAVLNPYSFRFTGFEISPASSHISIKGAAGKTQGAMNAELAIKWEREVSKRNDYFDRFGINVVTFTDSHLKDPAACFEKICAALTQRRESRLSVQDAVNALNAAHRPSAA